MAAQRIDEEVVQVPVRVTNAFGKLIEQPITVTVWQRADARSYPLMLVNHGRATDRAGRERVGRARYSDASRWLAGLGWSVWVPTRIGYGVSGVDEDPEDTGACSRKRYLPGYDVGAEQLLQVIEFARKRQNIDGSRVAAIGQSFGGALSVTLAGRMPQGLLGTVNFAGGGGGNPDTRPGEPCDPNQLEQLFGSYGRTARVPTLWIYTENDRYFKPKYTRSWYDAFVKEGGKGEFMLIPPFGEDGHLYFTRGFASWKPLVEKFLAELKP